MYSRAHVHYTKSHVTFPTVLTTSMVQFVAISTLYIYSVIGVGTERGRGRWGAHAPPPQTLLAKRDEYYFKMVYQNQRHVSKVQASPGFFDEICAPTIS